MTCASNLHNFRSSWCIIDPSNSITTSHHIYKYSWNNSSKGLKVRKVDSTRRWVNQLASTDHELTIGDKKIQTRSCTHYKLRTKAANCLNHLEIGHHERIQPSFLPFPFYYILPNATRTVIPLNVFQSNWTCSSTNWRHSINRTTRQLTNECSDMLKIL